MPPKVEHIPYDFPDDVIRFESNITYQTIYEAIRKYLPDGGSVLDIGSGRGELMEKLSGAGYEVCGIDMDDVCIRMSRRFGTVVKMEICDISVEKFDRKFDCILISHVLEHLENPRETLVRLATLSNGLIVTSVPNPYNLSSVLRALFRVKPSYMNTGHLQVWDWSHYKTFIEIGCSMELMEYFHDSVPTPIFHVGRRLLQKTGLIRFIEYRLLRTVFPNFCRSITAVIRTEKDNTV